MSEPNGNLTLDPSGAMARLLERVEHIDQVVSRLERLTGDRPLQAMETLLARADDLDRLAKTLDQIPGHFAMVVDLFDDWAKEQAARGIDLEKGLRQGLFALLWLGQQVDQPELQKLASLLRSEALEPRALAVVGKTGKALAACHSNAESPPTAGPIAAMKALKDPDIQRSLAFLLRVAKSFGAEMNPLSPVAEPDPQSNGLISAQRT